MIVECTECGKQVQANRELVMEIGKQNIICEVCERGASTITVDCQECGEPTQARRDLVMDVGKNNIICESCDNDPTEDTDPIKNWLIGGIILSSLLLAGALFSIIQFNPIIAIGLFLGSISIYSIYLGIKKEDIITIGFGAFILVATIRIVSRGLN